MTKTEKLRAELIEIARNPAREVSSYEVLANKIDGYHHRSKGFYEDLLKVSQAERRAGRPLLSAIVVNKMKGVPGAGFYSLFESEEGAEINDVERLRLFDLHREAVFNFWNSRSATFDGPEFFTIEELEVLNSIANQKYNKTNEAHQRIKRLYIDSIHVKIEYWADRLLEVLPGFKATVENRWLKGQSTFQRYSWGRIYREEHSKNGIFFTLAAATAPAALEYKLDCKSEGTSRQLTEEQADRVKDSIPAEARSVRVPLEAVPEYGWDKLVRQSRDFIVSHLDTYDWLHDLVKELSVEKDGQTAPESAPLRETAPPPGIKEFPETKRTFKGRDPDYEAIGRERTKTGTAGEELVRKLEKEKLAGTPYANNKIEKQADGVGYDLKSWTKAGEELHIEVKTTTGGIDTPFYLTANELAYAKLPENKDCYVIYRIYDYSIRYKTGKYFIIRNVAESIVKEPTVYKCRYKGPG